MFFLTVEYNENSNEDHAIDYEVKRLRTIENKMDFEFTRFDPTDSKFDILE